MAERAAILVQIRRPARVERWRRAARSPTLVAGAVLMALIVGAALTAPLLTPYDPSRHDLDHTFEGPTRAHPLGTDNFGRDLLARVLHGARIDLMIGVFATAVTLAVGTALGLLAGYYG